MPFPTGPASFRKNWELEIPALPVQSQAEMKPSEAYRKFNNKEINGTQLMRHVLEYDDFLIPGRPGHAPMDAYFGTEKENCFHLFEDSEHFAIWQKKREGDPLIVGPFPACEVVPQLVGSLDFLNINPDSGDVFHYRKHQLADMKKMAASIALEKALHDVAQADRLFGMLKNYEQYQMLFRSGGEGGMQLVLAPDEQGRKLIPVFTAEDCFQVWLDRMLPVIKKEMGIPYVVTRKGSDLFAELANYSTDGVVFNPVGNSRPRAFAMPICSIVANQ